MEQSRQDIVEPEVLKKLFPLGNFPSAELEVLSDQIQPVKGRKGKVLVEVGDDDGQAVYLLTGKFEVTDEQGNVDIIQTGSSKSHFPVSYGQPHNVHIKCMEASTYFRLDRQIVENLLHENQAPNRVALEELPIPEEYADSQLYRDLMCAYYTYKLEVPILPDVAVRIQNILQGDYQIREIEAILQSDLSMAAMIIKSANSPLFRGAKKVETIEQAIIRLGVKVIGHLITRYSVGNLFKPKHPEIARRAKQAWMHSAEVAAYAYVLAERFVQFDPEHALTLGLLHDIGTLPILYYADRYPELLRDERIDGFVEALRGPIGAAIFDKWGLSDEYVEVALHADDWNRCADNTDNYADLIKLAQLHTFVGKSKEQIAMRGAGSVPEFSAVPAFDKYGFDTKNPEQSVAIINEAKRKLESFRELFSGIC